MPFIEAFRQFQFKVKRENFCNIHVSLVPQVRHLGLHFGGRRRGRTPGLSDLEQNGAKWRPTPQLRAVGRSASQDIRSAQDGGCQCRDTAPSTLIWTRGKPRKGGKYPCPRWGALGGSQGSPVAPSDLSPTPVFQGAGPRGPQPQRWQ